MLDFIFWTLTQSLFSEMIFGNEMVWGQPFPTESSIYDDINCLSSPVTINREMRNLIQSLQNHNQQLRVESQRYKRRLRETQAEMAKVRLTVYEHLKVVLDGDMFTNCCYLAPCQKR